MLGAAAATLTVYMHQDTRRRHSLAVYTIFISPVLITYDYTVYSDTDSRKVHRTMYTHPACQTAAMQTGYMQKHIIKYA